MSVKKILEGIVGTLLFVGLFIFQMYSLFDESRLCDNAAKKMFLELAVCLIILLISNLYCKNKGKIIIFVAMVLSMSYLHSTILPFLIAIIYFVEIYFAGKFVWSYLIGKEDMQQDAVLLGSLLCGLELVCIIVAVLSVFKIYSIRNIWIILTCFAVGGMVKHKKIVLHDSLFSNKISKLSVTLIELSILLQIGRVGLQGDFDGVWYGLRSSSVLAHSSAGIYEDLGLVGFTYLYPKGFETILLSLTGFPSWNVQFIFNCILMGCIVIISWKIAKKLTNVDIAFIIAALVGAMPALMNMAITVKPDVITVLFQLAVIYFIMLYNEKKDERLVYAAIGTVLASYSFKITSLLFSSAIVVGLLPFVNIKSLKPSKDKIKIILPGCATIVLIWGRNYILTGAPLIAFLSKIYDALGWKIKYPYALQGGINEGGGSLIDAIVRLGENLKGYFILPLGQKFSHIIIAWPTSIVMFIFIIASCILIKKGFKVVGEKRWICLFVIVEVAMLLGMAFVNQADGNYFLICYIIIIIFAGVIILKNAKQFTILFVLAIGFELVISSLTSWSWASGFTTIQLKNEGYINQKNNYKEIYEQRNGNVIYDQINSSSDNRVIMLSNDVVNLVNFECIVERWYDIMVSNPTILESVENFYEYLSKCNISYIYVDDRDVLPDSNEEMMLEKLVKYGAVSDIVYENNNCLLKISKQLERNDAIIEKFCERRGKIVNLEGVYEDGWAGRKIALYVKAKNGKINFDIYVPYEISETIPVSIYVDGEKYEEYELCENNARISLDVPKQKYVKIEIVNGVCKKFENDARELSYIFNTTVE